MVFNATFNNISAISWRSVLLVEETGVPGENHQPVTSHWQTLSHNVVHDLIHNMDEFAKLTISSYVQHNNVTRLMSTSSTLSF